MNGRIPKIAINGFGRIGRQFFKVAFDNPMVQIVAINDLGSLDNLAYLLEFDTVYGHYDKKVGISDDGKYLIIENPPSPKALADAQFGNPAGRSQIGIKFFQESNPTKLPWKDLDIDIVVESTGRFASYDKAKAHLDAGAKRAVITAPAEDEGGTITATPNVNEAALIHSKITSNASCTTNAITPVAAIMMKDPGIKYSLLNTVHGVTAEQNLVDGPMPPLHKDFRRGRAAGWNLVPTTTGAAIAAAKAIPGMKDKFDGIALRAPVLAGSILDFTFLALRKTSAEEINNIFIEESKKPEWKGIMTVTDKPMVSSDIIRNPHGAIIDLNLTRVVGGELVKIMSWYDNEWGYANMLLKHILSLIPLL